MDNIYEHTDYRKFLSDRLEGLREKNPRLSYRNINKRFGFNSSGFINGVLDGSRNIGNCSMNRICRGLEMDEKETRFFELMVHFGQAKTPEEKEYYYNKLNELKRIPVDHKELSTLTIEAPACAAEKIRQKIQEFLNDIHATIESLPEERTDVLHISLQMSKRPPTP